MKPKFQLTRGGIQYFDAGGNVAANTTYNTNAPDALRSGDPLRDMPGITKPMHEATNQVVGGAIEGTGNVMKSIGSAFTAQNPYAANLAPTMQSNYGNVIDMSAGNALNGYGQFNQNLNNQNSLANALMMQSQGYGPNPAMAQFANTTGQNISGQAALMAGQRGASSNPGLIARQIAQQGAGVQQNAVGQAAALQAQQQLAAQSAAANLYGNIGNQITGQQNANTNLFTGAAGAQNAQNTGDINNYSMAQGINAQTAQNNANAVNKTTGGIMNSAGKLFSMFMAEGGEVPNPKTANVPSQERTSNKFYPSHLKAIGSIYHPEHFADGGMIQVPNFVTPMQDYSSNSEDSGVDKGVKSAVDKYKASSDGSEGGGGTGGATGASAGSLGLLESKGGEVPGKAKVKGDSQKNDTVPAMLSPDEVVIPRSVMHSGDPVGNAAKFVAEIISQNPSGNEEDDFKMAVKKAISQRGKK